VLALLASGPSASWAGGVRGISPDGEKGWLHKVDRGDTLWDITELYLGSAWIWPSVWRDNEIPNPHRIDPGDLRKSAAMEDDDMRRLTGTVVFDPGLPRDYKQQVDCRVRLVSGQELPTVISLNFTWE